ncbi:hypothetical protein BC938DRAFT_481067 [Jimgerdemannia flammicorona]|uniref:Uncharacterized protein n=1 Tax=Jimgerdemannia flammicorona TaxID=994334 RepID=A0A433QH20_9FUNG|nr:hypothetical protein BC938DRAFT_481067 [Jimgerdemannia flammicorona]
MRIDWKRRVVSKRLPSLGGGSAADDCELSGEILFLKSPTSISTGPPFYDQKYQPLQPHSLCHELELVHHPVLVDVTRDGSDDHQTLENESGDGDEEAGAYRNGGI